MKSLIKSHPWQWAMGLIALMTVALVACGGAEAPTAAPAAPTKAADVVLAPTIGIVNTKVPQSTAAPAATPTPGAVATARDTARFVTGEEPTTLGAASANCGGNIQNTVCDDIASDPLTWIDGKTFEVVPMTQIESWEQLEPDRWRFKLREGITFHNGAPWNATQAAFCIDFFGD